MTWQDVVIAVGQFVFAVALIPSVRGRQKPRHLLRHAGALALGRWRLDERRDVVGAGVAGAGSHPEEGREAMNEMKTRRRAEIPAMALYCYDETDEHCEERLVEAMNLLLDIWADHKQDLATMLVRRMKIAKGITFEDAALPEPPR